MNASSAVERRAIPPKRGAFDEDEMNVSAAL